jgi:D-inositol-3-phosphate glycosyltransferase
MASTPASRSVALDEGITKEELPSQLCALTSSMIHSISKFPSDYYDVIHSHYSISGQLGLDGLRANRYSTRPYNAYDGKGKNLALAEGEKPEPHTREIGESQVVAASTALIANTDAEAACTGIALRCLPR